ncbi:MAG: hypothetical protein COC12_14075, partial [Rhodobacteraceae bacterium]
LPALRAFLHPRAATSLSLSCALEDTDHPKAMTYWAAFNNANIHAVFGLSQQGILLCEAPDFDPNRANDLRRALSGREIIGLSGEARQIATLRSVLGLDQTPTTYDKIEPLLRMTLDDLIVPPGPTQLRNMHNRDLPLVRDWRLAFDREVYDEGDTPDLRQRSKDRATRMTHSGQGRLLELDRTPVSMTAFNAALGGIVQVGSVYTPPALRGRGHARRAVALHLAQAGETGTKSAILYSLSPAATRAYQSIGFTRIGDYAVMDFAKPVRIGDPA